MTAVHGLVEEVPERLEERGGGVVLSFVESLWRIARVPLRVVATVVITVLMSSVIVALAVVGRSYAARRVARWWCRTVVRLSGVEWSLLGTRNLLGLGGCVMVANHCSRFECPSLFLGLDGTFDIAVSRRLSLTPVWGQAMLALGFLPIDRWNVGVVRRRIKRSVESVRRGRRVLFFPEGRRVQGRRLLPFKTGAFRLAVAAGVPVVPIAVADGELTGWSAAAAARRRLVLTIGDPIPTKGLDQNDIGQLVVQSREAIETMLNPCRRVAVDGPQISPSPLSRPPGPRSCRPGAPRRADGSR